MPDKPLPLKPDNVDSPADDPKKALLVDLKGIIDRYNQLLDYLGSAAGKDAGTEAGEMPVYESGGGIAGLRMKANTARDGLVRLATLEQVKNRLLGDEVVTLTGLRASTPKLETVTWEYDIASWAQQRQTFQWKAPQTALTKAGRATYPVKVSVEGVGRTTARITSPGGSSSFGSLVSAPPGGGKVEKEVQVTPGRTYTVTVGRPIRYSYRRSHTSQEAVYSTGLFSKLLYYQPKTTYSTQTAFTTPGKVTIGYEI